MVAELLSERLPLPLLRLGIRDPFGESGTPRRLLEFFKLTGPQLAQRIRHFVAKAAHLNGARP